MKNLQIPGSIRNDAAAAAGPLLLCSILFGLAATPFASAAIPEKNVFFLYSFSRRDTFDSLEQLKAVIRDRVAGPVNFNVEYLDSQRSRVPGYEDGLSQAFRNAYHGSTIDVVVVGGYPALRFVIDHREQVFPGVPIVFMMVVPARLQGHKLWPGVTGVTARADVRGTIDLALRLGPDTRNIAVISGNSEFEEYWLEQTRRELRSRQSKLNVIEFIGLPPDQLLNSLSRLPAHSVAFFELIPSEAAQPALGIYEVLAAVSERLPTYCIHNYCLDHGAVGGSYPDADEQIVTAGTIVARVLRGETPESIPVVHGSIDHVQVDWRQLKRWHFSESRLPPGALVLYRQPSFWERDRQYIIAAVILFVVQALLIIGLLMLRARKRKTEAVLRESENRFGVLADTTPSLIWMCDQAGRVTYLNDRRLVFSGKNANEGYGDTWTAYVHPEDLQPVQEAISEALQKREPFSKEYRLRRRDGTYRWMFDVASPQTNGDGSFAGFIGSAIDVTDQKLAQEALEKISGQLIEAQEKERTRIARDLHDDICQRLALLSMELEQANRNGAPPTTKKQLAEIRQHCAEITGDIQSLSHQLHSSKLEYLGTVAAIKGFCKEFAKQHDVSIEFRDENVPTPLPQDVSLCLFRVTQEALQNAAKHSGTTHFSVDLRSNRDEVQLVVSDAGAGFDVEEAKRNRGLGLVSMQERVHLVHGRFNVASRPGGGTRIVAVVPVAAVSAISSAEGENNQAANMTGAA